MSVGLIKQMQTTLAGLLQQVAAYQGAIAIAEKEARIAADGTFKGAFEARVKKPRKAAKKLARARRDRLDVPDAGAPQRRQAKPGALRDFMKAHADPHARPTEEARRLLPLAHKAGIPTTIGSLVVGLGKLRAAQNGGPDLRTPLLAHLQQFGPMPFPNVRDWFAETYPKEAEENPRTAIGLLTGLKGEGKASLTPDGWWQAV